MAEGRDRCWSLLEKGSDGWRDSPHPAVAGACGQEDAPAELRGAPGFEVRGHLHRIFADGSIEVRVFPHWVGSGEGTEWGH